jgi:DNA replication and repair protein RecF
MTAANAARLVEAANGGRALAVRRLSLRDFRNYAELSLTPEAGIIALVGENGAGKTNLLEAVSLLAPGRGLRRAKLAELDRIGAGPWRITARVEGRDGPCDLVTAPQPESERRLVERDGTPLRSQAELAEVLSLVWLTPAMDRLLVDSASSRRRFLDRLVLAIDGRHAARASTYERLLRERSFLLRQGRHDAIWLRALERRIAAAAVAVAAARNELVRDLAKAVAEPGAVFPAPQIAICGEVEGWLATMPALTAEERLAEALTRSRPADTESGGAAIGPHRSDLLLADAQGQPAARCSTGQQKAFLISIVLAEARLRRQRFGDLPILLLDEVAAHLDAARREQLLFSLEEIGAQAWLTGTDAELFAPLRGRCQLCHVRQGNLTTP